MTRHVYGIEETATEVLVWRFPSLRLLRIWLRQFRHGRWVFSDDDRVRRARRKDTWHTADDGVSEYEIKEDER